MTIRVTEHGAIGDGKADDTAAIQSAIDRGRESGEAVFFPPGRYRVRTLRLYDRSVLRADPTWSYRHSGVTQILPYGEDVSDRVALIDARETIGVRLNGLSVCGEQLGEGLHGLVATKPAPTPETPNTEMNLTLDGCHFRGFSGSGIVLEAWAFSIRNSMFHANGLDGADLSGSYDGWINDCIFAGNRRYGLGSELLASVTMQGCRIEWNRAAGIRLGSNYAETVQINNCLFDHDYGPALRLAGRELLNLVVSGNLFRRSGREPIDQRDGCHLDLDNISGISVTGNTLLSGYKDNEDGTRTRYGMCLSRLSHSVVSTNVILPGHEKEPILDLGGHDNLICHGNTH